MTILARARRNTRGYSIKMAPGRMRGVLLLVAVFCLRFGADAKPPPDNRVEALELSTVTREVDVTSPLMKQRVKMVVENKGSKPVTAVLYTVEPQLADKVAFISAQVSCTCACELYLSSLLPPTGTSF